MQSIDDILLPALNLLGNKPYLKSFVVVVLTLLLANLITWVLLGILQRLASLSQGKLDDILVKALKSPVFYTVLMLGLTLSVNLMPISETLQDNLISVLQSIGILVWTRFTITLSKAVLDSLSNDQNRLHLVQAATLPLFQNLAAIIILAVAVYLLFNAWEIDMSAWLASAGIVGIAVGFAAKDTLSNLFSGVFILADAPYKIGDYVVLDGGERGKITHIGIRSTRMLTRDDVELTIPNAIMGNSKVINESGGPHLKYRIRIPVGVAYGSDIDQVETVLKDIALAEQRICQFPEPKVRFRALGASSLDFELLGWVSHPELRGQASHFLLKAVYKQFNEHGIEIPYAKQDIYIKEMPEHS